MCFRQNIVVAILSLFTFVSGLHAAESGPRAYQNVPVGTNVAQLYYNHSETRGSLNIKSDIEVLRYYRYFDFFGNAAAVGAYLPYANAKLSIPAFGLNQSTSGMGDAVLVFGFDLYGGPAIALDEYKSWVQKTIIGFSAQLTLPTGKYDKTKIVNIGSNRWAFRPELAISHQIGTSGVYVESYLNYQMFTKNSEYLGNFVRQQGGIVGVDGHLSYAFMRGAFVSLDYLRSWGGETSVNGVKQRDQLRDIKFGATLKVAFNRNTAAELKYRDDAHTESGNKTRAMQLKLQYIW
jgi:hypothetical protein